MKKQTNFLILAPRFIGGLILDVHNSDIRIFGFSREIEIPDFVFLGSNCEEFGVVRIFPVRGKPTFDN